jgi:hypothetical protein
MGALDDLLNLIHRENNKNNFADARSTATTSNFQAGTHYKAGDSAELH